jgi:DNA-binding transcriptional LysR family regulator
METLSGIESFVRSAELGSFSAAARRLSMTPGGVSKNVAKLEADMGIRLFQRSTRKLTLTEAGEQFLQQVAGGLDTIKIAIANASNAGGKPAGTLKVGMAMAFGRDQILPLLGDFLALYPEIKPDWRFDNRQVDLIAEGFDVAIGGGIQLAPGIVMRQLAKVHLILAASPEYLKSNSLPTRPEDLYSLDTLMRFSQTTSRVTPWHLRSKAGEQVTVEPIPRATLNDPEALCCAALKDLGVVHVPMPHALPYLKSGSLVRILPDWYSDGGEISIYFTAKKLMPAKTRVFIDFVIEHFKKQDLAKQWSAI